MTTSHIHAPRCCCPTPADPVGVHIDCPACPEHGAKAAPEPAAEVLCGFLNLADPSQVCDYPPHDVAQPHSWNGWRHAVKPDGAA